MIESIWTKNLLCFNEKEHRINCAPLTVLVGPNNSGKSAMITAFNLLRDVGFRGGPYWTTESYNLGDYETAVYKHDKERKISLGARVRQGSLLVNFFTTLSADGDLTGLSHDSSLTTAPNLLTTSWYFRASRSDIARQRQTGQPGATPIWGQPLDPSGSNIITYLLERWTDQDEQWSVAQEWLKKVDPELSILKSPLRGNQASLETKNRYSDVSVNLAYQGTGMQKVLTIIAGIIFSPPNSTIIIEEPEVHLERGSIEVLVDLFNYAVNNWKKQIIMSTHSIDLLLQYASDVGLASRRGREHVAIEPSKFKLISFSRDEGEVQITDEDMAGRFTTVMDRLRSLLKPEAKVTVPLVSAAG